MKALLPLLCLLYACGDDNYLQEGMYTVTLIETSNSCGWANGDTGIMTWAITNVGKHYGITHMTNKETLACTQEKDSNIHCLKDKEAYVNRCKYLVEQNIVLEPQEDFFTGNFAIDFVSCLDETCGQEAVIKGEWFADLPTP